MDLIPISTRDLFFSDPFFRSSWDDFGRVREGMMAEPRDMLRRFEDEFMNARCMMEGGMPWSSKFGSDSLMFPRRAMLPSMTNPLVNMFKDVDLFTMPGDSELIRCTQDKDKLEVSLDTSMYRPSELSVKCENGLLHIRGCHETEEAGGRRKTFREFRRHFTLPEGCTPEDLESNLSADGVLVVSCKGHPAIEEKKTPAVESGKK